MRGPRPSVARACLLLAGCLLLAACGFHLRGAVSLPAGMTRIHLVGAGPYSPLGIELHRALRGAGAAFVPARQASALLVVMEHHIDRRVLSVDTNGKVREYELVGTLSFRVEDLQGKPLVPVQRLMVRRSYLFDPNDVLGKAAEEQNLRQQMRRDLVRLALMRLELAGRHQPGR